MFCMEVVCLLWENGMERNGWGGKFERNTKKSTNNTINRNLTLPESSHLSSTDLECESDRKIQGQWKCSHLVILIISARLLALASSRSLAGFTPMWKNVRELFFEAMWFVNWGLDGGWAVVCESGTRLLWDVKRSAALCSTSKWWMRQTQITTQCSVGPKGYGVVVEVMVQSFV
jgi:hypothetical protein